MWSCIVTGSVTGLTQASATLEMYTSLVVLDNLKCIIAKEFVDFYLDTTQSANFAIHYGSLFLAVPMLYWVAK